ncbi:MAG: type II toxin-antitoxin system VapC family toxin [Gemmatimonadota bacterium]
MRLVDSNILMYAAGARHRNKEPSLRFLERVARGDAEAAVDAKVLQEVLRHYRAIGRWHDGWTVYDRARTIFPVVIPVTADILDAARGLMDRYGDLSTRDALHAGVVIVHGFEGIVSFDRDFDQVEELRRFEPE